MGKVYITCERRSANSCYPSKEGSKAQIAVEFLHADQVDLLV